MPIFIVTFLAAILVIAAVLGLTNSGYGHFNFFSFVLESGISIFLAIVVILIMAFVSIFCYILLRRKRGFKRKKDEEF